MTAPAPAGRAGRDLMPFAVHCACGATMKGKVSPAWHASALVEIFMSEHTDPGCAIVESVLPVATAHERATS